MKIAGYILIALGALAALSAFGFDTAPEGTHNIGLLQEQMMWLASGSVVLICGVLLLVAGEVLGRLERAGIIPPAGTKYANPVRK